MTKIKKLEVPQFTESDVKTTKLKKVKVPQFTEPHFKTTTFTAPDFKITNKSAPIHGTRVQGYKEIKQNKVPTNLKCPNSRNQSSRWQALKMCFDSRNHILRSHKFNQNKQSAPIIEVFPFIKLRFFRCLKRPLATAADCQLDQGQDCFRDRAASFIRLIERQDFGGHRPGASPFQGPY